MARSAYRDAFTRTDNSRPSTANSEKKELWSTLLDNVSSGKKIPEKHLIILGGTSETQKDFLDSLQQDTPSRLKPPDRSKARKTPVANSFALGYTYHHIYDSDHDGLLPLLSLAFPDVKLTSDQTSSPVSPAIPLVVLLPHMLLSWPVFSLLPQYQIQPLSSSLTGLNLGPLCALFVPGYDY